MRKPLTTVRPHRPMRPEVDDSGCYACGGTGFVHWGTIPAFTPCLHHSVDCEPDGCAPDCEQRAQDEA